MMSLKDFGKYIRNNYVGPISATDTIIRHNGGEKEGVVMIERKYPPYGVAWPGGIAEKMTYGENAIKEGKEETGLDVVLDNPYKPLCVLSDPDQDPREHISSITYVGTGTGILKPHPKEDAKKAVVVTHDELSDLVENEGAWAFPHHRTIAQIYLEEVSYSK